MGHAFPKGKSQYSTSTIISKVSTDGVRGRENAPVAILNEYDYIKRQTLADMLNKYE